MGLAASVLCSDDADCSAAPTIAFGLRPLQTIEAYDVECRCDDLGWTMIARVRDDAARTSFRRTLRLDPAGRVGASVDADRRALSDEAQVDPSCPPIDVVGRMLEVSGGRTISRPVCKKGDRGTVVIGANESDGTEVSAPLFVLSVFDRNSRRIASTRLEGYQDVNVHHEHDLVGLADLNRDGRQEVLISKTEGNPISYHSTLIVLEVRGAGFTALFEEPLGFFEPVILPEGEHGHSEGFDCRATVEINQGGVLIGRMLRRDPQVPPDRKAPTCVDSVLEPRDSPPI